MKGFYESGGGRGGGGGGGSLVHPPHHQPQGTVYDVRYLVDGDVAYWYWGSRNVAFRLSVKLSEQGIHITFRIKHGIFALNFFCFTKRGYTFLRSFKK